MHDQFSKTSGNQNRVSGFLCLFVLSLLTTAFAFTSLHAQTVAYVTNLNDSTVSVIDTAANTVTATIPIGSRNVPVGVVVSPDGTRAYVTDLRGNLSVIDTASNAVVAVFQPLGGNSLGYPAITPDGKTLYVPGDFNTTVAVVSTATNTVTSSFNVPGVPFCAAVSPDGAHLYLLGGAGLVSVVATASNTVVASITTNSSPGIEFPFLSIAISPEGGNVYLANGFGHDVPVIATASNTVITNVPFSRTSRPNNLAVTPDGSRVYVSDSNGNVVDVIDTATNTLEPVAIPVGQSPFGLAITPDGTLVDVANFNDGTVSVIATATNTVVATVPVGNGPFGIAIANLPITANFNGTAIPSGDALWFSSVAKVSGLGSSPVKIFISNSTITFTANGSPVTVSVPNAILTFDPNATTATTTFNVGLNQWQTTVPSSGLAGNVLLDGVPLPLPNGLPGGIKNVTWSASFSTDTPGISLNWQWAAAAYSSLDLNCGSDGPGVVDLNCLGVKPVDDNQASQYKNSDHAGSPENSKTNVVGGATGGGGSNFTGGLSGTQSVKPKVVP